MVSTSSTLLFLVGIGHRYRHERRGEEGNFQIIQDSRTEPIIGEYDKCLGY